MSFARLTFKKGCPTYCGDTLCNCAAYYDEENELVRQAKNALKDADELGKLNERLKHKYSLEIE